MATESENSTDTKGGASQHSERPLCVGYSEIDKYASSVYEYHFKGVKNYGDITKINAEELPDFDCLVGGFPCQAFSIAGKRNGFKDTRGTLFFDLARILKQKQPRYFVFENVKGLLSHDYGRTFTTIVTAIDELGYDCQWQVLNSKNHGVPQNRERIIIVGHLRGTTRPQVFPLEGTVPADSVIRTIRAGGASSFTEKHARDIIKVNPKIIQRARGKNKGGEKDIAPSITGMAYKDNNHLAIPVITPDRAEKRQNGRRMKENGEPAFTVTSQDRHGIYDGAKIRRLTPLECERLQGFPDGWTLQGGVQGDITISDSQRYKMCGNAVTTNVIESVFEQIFKNRGIIKL